MGNLYPARIVCPFLFSLFHFFFCLFVRSFVPFRCAHNLIFIHSCIALLVMNDLWDELMWLRVIKTIHFPLSREFRWIFFLFSIFVVFLFDLNQKPVFFFCLFFIVKILKIKDDFHLVSYDRKRNDSENFKAISYVLSSQFVSSIFLIEEIPTWNTLFFLLCLLYVCLWRHNKLHMCFMCINPYA